MTEEPRQDAYDEAAEPVEETDHQPVDQSDVEPADEPDSTGHPAVDEVLRSLDALGDAPVDGHVAVFEQAHDQLRRTLQGAGDDQD